MVDDVVVLDLYVVFVRDVVAVVFVDVHSAFYAALRQLMVNLPTCSNPISLRIPSLMVNSAFDVDGEIGGLIALKLLSVCLPASTA